MKKSHVRRAARAAIVAAVVGVVQDLEAAPIIYDLRFADGSHEKIAAPGSYAVELWARVTGTNANNNDDGLKGGLMVMMSTQTGGGAIVSGGITGANLTTDFQSFSGSTPLHSNGSGSDLNGDTITDWGSTSTSNANTNYLFGRSSGILTGPSVGQAVGSSAWEFKLANVTISIGSVNSNPGSTTLFRVVKPNTRPSGPTAITYITGRMDNVTFNVTSTNQQGVYTDSIGITFIPEPSSIGLLGAASVLGLSRRRGAR